MHTNDLILTWKCYRLVAFPRVIMMYFQRIRDLREDHDKTQQQIANYLNTHRNAYGRYEIGVREIPTWAVIKLAELYNTSTDYILGRTDDPAPPSA